MRTMTSLFSRVILALCLIRSAAGRKNPHHSVNAIGPDDFRFPDETDPADIAKGLATHAAVAGHTLGGGSNYPIPRANMPDGFGAKVAFQTVRSTNAKGEDIVTERLVRCGIEKFPDGSDVYPCNPSFDTRPYIKGLDHIGTGFDALTGERRAPLFEWSVPAWFKPAYDSGKYNYDFKIPEQITLTGVPSGEGGMVTELFQNYAEYESKSSFASNIGFGALGASVGFSLSKTSTRFRSAFDNFEIGVSKQKYELYQLSIKRDIYGTCPYNEAVFAAEQGRVNTADARESPSDGQVADWTADDAKKWAEEAKLPQEFADNLVANGIPGGLLVALTDDELNELGLKTPLQRHKFHYDLDIARKKETGEASTNDVGGGGTGLIGEGDVENLGNASSTKETGVGGKVEPESVEAPSEETTTFGLDFAHPRYLRKWIMRQAFIDAVNALPVFSDRQIKHICPYFDAEREREDNTEATAALWSDTNISQSMYDSITRRNSVGTQVPEEDAQGVLYEELTPASAAAVLRYRRFLFDWGTHWASAVTMGGEVEVTTMVRKRTTEQRAEDTLSTETNIEAKEKAAEDANDEETEASTVVDTSSKTPSVEGTENEVAKPETSTHMTMKKDASSKGQTGAMAALRGALESLASGGAASLVKEAIQNLELKLKISTSKSARSKNVLTNENNKNELKFVGGDTAVDPDAVGGAQFAAWKDTIKDNPAPIQKTLTPITELILAFAGPNAGEQCPSAETHARIGRVAQMLECMTKLLLREGRDLADTVYEIGQIDAKKAALDREVAALVKCENTECEIKKKKITMEWQQICTIRMTLQAKRDRQHAQLFAFTHKFPSNSPTAARNYNKMCERELASLTAGQQTRIVSGVTKVDAKTGREITDRCQLCMAVYDNAKCLATRKECGPRNEEVQFDTKENRDFIAKINEVDGKQQCAFSEHYDVQRGPGSSSVGALPKEVEEWIRLSSDDGLSGAEKKTILKKWRELKAKFQGGTGWMGWSAILYGPVEVLCDKVSNQNVCHDFVQNLRAEMCRSPTDDSAASVRRSSLIGSLDFGARGENVDATTARSACECSGYCVPDIDTKKGWQLHYESSTERGWLGIIFSNIFHKEAMRIQYEESLIADALETCVSRKPQPAPLTPKNPNVCEAKQVWMKQVSTETLECGPEYAAPELTSYFLNTIAYIGHCKPGSFCFSFDVMNQADMSKTSLYLNGPENDKGTPTLAITDIDPADPDVAERRSNRFGMGSLGEVVNFRAWGESTNRPWKYRGIVYAEIMIGGKGLPKLVIVQSGLPKKNHPNFFANLAKKFMDSLKGTMDLAGPNLDDPRMILVAEDRQGNSIGGRDEQGMAHGVCAWLYHICCAIGGTLHPDTENPNFRKLDQTCPRGTVCCPPSEAQNEARAAPWTVNTIELLWTMTHGRLKGAPRMDMNDNRQGWKTMDPISATGPSMCPNGKPDMVRKFFSSHAAVSDSRSARREKEAMEKSITSKCIFVCKEKSGMMSSKRCMLGNGMPMTVEVPDVKKGQCEKGGLFSGSGHMGKATVAKAKELCGAKKEGCGYKVDFQREIASISSEDFERR